MNRDFLLRSNDDASANGVHRTTSNFHIWIVEALAYGVASIRRYLYANCHYHDRSFRSGRFSSAACKLSSSYRVPEVMPETRFICAQGYRASDE